MLSLFKYTLTLAVLMCSFSSLSQHLASNQYVDSQVIVTFDLKKKVEGIDFEVNRILQPVESDLTVYTAKKPFNAEHCTDGGTFSVIQEIAVKKGSKLIWRGSGYFDALEFSPDGQNFYVKRLHYSRHEHIVINDKVTINEVKYANYDKEPDKINKPCYSYEGVDELLISNNPTHLLAFYVHDGLGTPLHICKLPITTGYYKCPSISLDGQDIINFYAAKIANLNEIYVFFNNQVIRYNNNNKLLWTSNFPADLNGEFYKLFLYKNLIITHGRNNIAVFSKDNGALLWQRSRAGEEKALATFDSIYAVNNQIIFQIQGTTIYGIQDISQFIVE